MAWLSYIKVKQSKTQLLHFLSYRLKGQNKARIANIQHIKRRVEKKKKKKDASFRRKLEKKNLSSFLNGFVQ